MSTINSKALFLVAIQESFGQLFTIIENVPTRKRKLTVDIEEYIKISLERKNSSIDLRRII